MSLLKTLMIFGLLEVSTFVKTTYVFQISAVKSVEI